MVSHLILSLSGPAPRRAAAAAARGWFGNAPPLFPRPFGGAEDPRPPPWHSGVGAPQLLRGYPAAGPAAPPAPTAPPPAPRPAAHGSSQPVAAAPLAQPALDWMPKPRMPEFALQGHGLAAAPQLSDPRGLFERCCFRHRELFCLCVCVYACAIVAYQRCNRPEGSLRGLRQTRSQLCRMRYQTHSIIVQPDSWVFCLDTDTGSTRALCSVTERVLLLAKTREPPVSSNL